MADKKFSRGIEKVIALAALDAEFSKKLLTDREAAIDSCDVKLTETEHAILLTIPDPQLDRAVSNVRVPDLARRKFLAGSIKTAVTIIIAGACIGGITTVIALPMLLRGKRAGQEAGAIANLRTIYAAQEQYKGKHGYYVQTLKELADEYISYKLPLGKRNGYVFKLSNVTEDAFQIHATPEEKNWRHFRIDQTGEIRYSFGLKVGPESKKLGEW